MLDEVLDVGDYDKLLYNESLQYCPKCQFTAKTIGGLNYHIGKSHLGEAKLVRDTVKGDKKLVNIILSLLYLSGYWSNTELENCRNTIKGAFSFYYPRKIDTAGYNFI